MRVIEALQPLEPQQRDRACIRLKKANTHISANPKFPDVKLFQVVDLITGLDKIAEMKIPLLVCGDFNSLPLSEPHKFITAGRVDNLPNDTDPFDICQHLKLHHSLSLELVVRCDVARKALCKRKGLQVEEEYPGSYSRASNSVSEPVINVQLNNLIQAVWTHG